MYEELESVLDSKEFINNRNKKFTVDQSFNLLIQESNKEKPTKIDNVDCSDVFLDKIDLNIPINESSFEQPSLLKEYILDKIDDDFSFKKSEESQSISSASSDTTIDENAENDVDNNENQNVTM